MASMSHRSQVPSYKISRRPDLSLQFEPPVGTIELANALGLSFPLEASLSDQMRCALLLHIEAESINPAASLLNLQQNAEVMSASTRNSFSGVTELATSVSIPANPTTPDSSWGITTGEPPQKKRKKTKYEASKRRKVAAVRKIGACPFHRAKKTECKCFSNISPTPLENDTAEEFCQLQTQPQNSSSQEFRSEESTNQNSSFEQLPATITDISGVSFSGLSGFFDPVTQPEEILSIWESPPELDIDNWWFPF